MYNFVNGMLVLFLAINCGVSVAQGHWIMAVISLVGAWWFYNKLESNVL
jgi:hypothetical protein